MNILITGGSSFLAKSLIDKLLYSGHNIYVISRKNNYLNYNIKTFNLNLSKTIEKTQLVKIFKSNKISFDCLFHFAFCVINKRQTDNESLLKKNIKITENIVRICELIKLKKFINISSKSVYYDLTSNNLNKQLRCKEYYYSLSNICSEKIINIKLKNIIKKIVHLRLSNVFTYSIYGRGIVNELFKELIKNNSITIYNKNRNLSYISIKYLIDNLIIYLNNNKNGTYDLKQTDMNIIDFASFLKKKFGNSETIIRYRNN
tara:strand:- start:414 stop:1193 length:780 start_codon:yes stop_codon:yes gene_type:complete